MDMSMLETIETDATAPRLSDGTAVSELIDLERREVSLRVHHDQEIFDLEMERIFTRSWLPVAHESEIPNPGDFVRRYAGQDSCLVVRRDDGSIAVLLNACPQLGMALCREEKDRESVGEGTGWAVRVDPGCSR